MTPFRLNQRKIGHLLWRSLLTEFLGFPNKNLEIFKSELNDLELLRSSAEYNTGSISFFSGFALAALTNHFRPKSIVEVGTFIGRSTIAMARGLDFANSGATIHTCDNSNNIDLPYEKGLSKIIQHKMKVSTEMFKKISEDKLSVDMFHFDGRITDEDLQIINNLKHEKTIYLLDDFEGIEKGVVNAIRMSGIIRGTHLLIYPPENIFENSFSFPGTSSTAMFFPTSLLAFTNQ